MRCPDCNKFVPFEVQEPEEDTAPEAVNNGSSAHVTAAYTIDRNCEECGQCLSQGRIEIDDDVEFTKTPEGQEVVDHEGHDLSIDDADAELYEDSDPATKQVPIKRGLDKGKMRTVAVPSRYRRSYIGVHLTGTINCDDCGVAVAEIDIIEKIGASEFEEQV